MDQRVQSRFGKGLGFRFGYVRMCQGSSLVRLELIMVKFGLGWIRVQIGLGQDEPGLRLCLIRVDQGLGSVRLGWIRVQVW